MTADRQPFQDFIENCYYNVRHKDWMSLSQAEYLKMLALDQPLVVLETPASSVEQWTRVFREAVGQ